MKEKLFLRDFPNALKQWDYELNKNVFEPGLIHVNSSKQYFWKCENGHPSYLCSVHKKAVRNYGCPVCSNHKVMKGINDFKSSNPKLMLDWNFLLNKDIDPEALSPKSIKVVNWKCHICGFEWKGRIRDATRKEINCPSCSLFERGRKRHLNYIEKNGGITKADLLMDWDYEKNAKKPSEYSPGSNEHVYWKCHKCGYQWKAKIANRTHSRGCPSCGNRVLIKGKNDLETKSPELAKEWDYDKNYPITPREVMWGSGKKYWWICPLGHDSYLMSPNRRTNQRSGCPSCNRGRQSSFAERAFYFYTKQLFPDAVNHYKEIFDNGMEIDIFIPSLHLGIEYDGVAFHKLERIQREERKYKICKENKIKLIRIKEQDIDKVFGIPIADEVYKTEYDGKDMNKLEDTIRLVLGKIAFNFNNLSLDIDIYRDEVKIRNIDPSFLKKNSLETKYPEIAKQWHPTKNGNLTPSMFLCGSSYKAWWRCPICGYEWQSQINTRIGQKTGCKKCYLERIKTNSPNNKKIYRYSLDGSFIDEWRSASFASRELSINCSNISMCANGKRKNAGGYIWSYEKKDLNTKDINKRKCQNYKKSFNEIRKELNLK